MKKYAFYDSKTQITGFKSFYIHVHIIVTTKYDSLLTTRILSLKFNVNKFNMDSQKLNFLAVRNYSKEL